MTPTVEILPACANGMFKVLAIIVLALTAFAASVFKYTVSFILRPETDMLFKALTLAQFAGFGKRAYSIML
jgi:hypothetical protein